MIYSEHFQRPALFLNHSGKNLLLISFGLFIKIWALSYNQNALFDIFYLFWQTRIFKN